MRETGATKVQENVGDACEEGVSQSACRENTRLDKARWAAGG